MLTTSSNLLTGLCIPGCPCLLRVYLHLWNKINEHMERIDQRRWINATFHLLYGNICDYIAMTEIPQRGKCPPTCCRDDSVSSSIITNHKFKQRPQQRRQRMTGTLVRLSGYHRYLLVFTKGALVKCQRRRQGTGSTTGQAPPTRSSSAPPR